MDIDDATLVERCRQGDDLAWEALVRRWQGRVYGLAWHYLGNAEDARDAAQEAFVRVYRQLGSFDGDRFQAWLLRITRNLCLDQLRRRKTRPPLEELRAADEDDAAPTDAAPSPEQAWLSGVRRRVVHEALRRLNGPNREVILLKDIQGLKLGEIAGMLGLPVGTVKSRAHRARLELARHVIAIDPSYADLPKAGGDR